jgi:transposase
MVLFEKFGQHRPLNRQAERYAKEGVPISLSTLADQVGGCTAALMPLFKRLEAYVSECYLKFTGVTPGKYRRHSED